VLDKFLHRLIEATRSLTVSPATDPACEIPPVIDDEAYRRLLALHETPEGGVEVVFRGEAPESAGCFVPPLILRIDDVHHPLMQRELFGPILAVTRATNFDDALEKALESEFALTGAVYSRQPSHLARAREKFRVGNLYLNRECTGSMVGRQPFGGFRMSGTDAKAGGPGYLLNFVDARCVTENTMRRGFTPDIML
jgi:RHH-type proline utilization regulon transcriptional repressor/proline dehydrogenase/delta 1-pyrroline-5-carboxylate dehydrogenase